MLQDRRRWLAIALIASLLAFGLPGSVVGQSIGEVSLPNGTPTTANLSSSSVSQLAPLLSTMSNGGRLPNGVTSQEIAALFAAPPEILPVSLAALVPSLESLGRESTLATAADAVSTALASGSTQGGSFSDVSSVPFAVPSISALATAGLVHGVAPGIFAPEAPLQQDQLIVLLQRLLSSSCGTAKGVATASLSGVPAWAESAMQQAVRSGMLSLTSGIAPDAQATVDRYQAITLLIRALGLGSLAQQFTSQPYPFTVSAPVPTWAQGPVTLAADLGLAKGVPGGSLQGRAPLTRADVAVFVARGLKLLDTVLTAEGTPAILSITPSPLLAGGSVTIATQGLGKAPGTATWQPAFGPTEPLNVTGWSDTGVQLTIPSGAAPGRGELVLTPATGADVSASATLGTSLFHTGAALADGLLPMSADGITFYTTAAGARQIAAESMSQQDALLSQLTAARHHGLPPAPESPTPKVLVPTSGVGSVPATTHRPQSAAVPGSGAPSDWVTQYSPAADSFSNFYQSVSTTTEVDNIPIGTAAGWVAGDTNLGTIQELGKAAGIATVNLDGELVATYTSHDTGSNLDPVTVEAKIITYQVDGGAMAEGAGAAPVSTYFNLEHAFPVGDGWGYQWAPQQQDTVSPFATTLSAAVAGVGGSDASEGLSLFNQLVDKGVSAFNYFQAGYGAYSQFEGAYGPPHVSYFRWTGTLGNGDVLFIYLDTSGVVGAVAAGTYLSGMRSVDIVRVTEQNANLPPLPPPPPSLQIKQVSETTGTPGDVVTVRGTDFGTVPGGISFAPDGGNQTLLLSQTLHFGPARVVSWSDHEVKFVVPDLQSADYLVTLTTSASGSIPFGFSIPTPKITSLSPTSGPPGTQIAITGQYFGDSGGWCSLGPVVSWSPTQVTCTVTPEWQSSVPFAGQATVTLYPAYDGGYASSAASGGGPSWLPPVLTFSGVGGTTPQPFDVEMPAFTGISSAESAPGQVVTVTGADFGEGEGTVTLYQKEAVANARVVSWSNGAVSFMVPDVGPGTYTLVVNADWPRPGGTSAWLVEGRFGVKSPLAVHAACPSTP